MICDFSRFHYLLPKPALKLNHESIFKWHNLMLLSLFIPQTCISIRVFFLDIKNYCISLIICHYSPFWCYDMLRVSVLLALYEGNPTMTVGLPSQRTSDAELWCMYSLMFARTSCWTNGHVADDLRYYDAHVTSTKWPPCIALGHSSCTLAVLYYCNCCRCTSAK